MNKDNDKPLKKDNDSLKKTLKESTPPLHNKKNAKKDEDYHTLYIAEQVAEDEEKNK